MTNYLVSTLVYKLNFQVEFLKSSHSRPLLSISSIQSNWTTANKPMTGFERPLASEVTAVPTVPQSLPLGDRVTSMTSQWWNIANYFCQIPLQNMSSWGSYATRWLSDIVYLPIWRNVLPNITFQRQITALCPRPYSIDTFVDKLYTRLHNATRKPKEQFLFIANEIIF